ncbi:hypothetical protein J9303_17670 [Bacillaceae bacterium Marseille-Q3522]|nr:hypothetical protein [Bacillaceae bacterium Marseille-Q3522]
MDSNLINNIRNKCYERKLISSGNNYPAINMAKGYLDLICVLLHERNRLDEIQDALSISKVQLNNNLKKLLTEGLLKKEEERFLPTFMVISEKEGEWLTQLCVDIGRDMIKLILNNKERMIEETYKITAFKKLPFEELSLFILSGTVLDFIQITNVEKCFLKAERPARNNKNYYFSIMEKKQNSSEEAFGIYGNHCENIGEMTFCMYGNERYSAPNLITLSDRQGKAIFGEQFIETKDFKKVLLDKMIRFQMEKLPLDENIRFGLERLNMIHHDTLEAPILKAVEYEALNNIADVMKDDLIELFESNRRKLFHAYANTLYKEETTFEEFFIWYYHFLYSYVTEELMKIGIVKKPKGRIFNYLIIG